MKFFVTLLLITLSFSMTYGQVDSSLHNKKPLIFWTSQPCVFENSQEQDSMLLGKWVLTKLEIENKNKNVISNRYFIEFSTTLIKYNTTYNECKVQNWSTKNKTINYNEAEDIECTELCCNNDFDTKIRYFGSYILSNSNSLIISNNDITLYLTKIKN